VYQDSPSLQLGAIFLGTAAKWHDIVVFSILLIFGSISFYFAFPHARERIDTFLNPSEDTLGSDYQIR
jgi:cell division protein FtsW (lipid II flippase)